MRMIDLRCICGVLSLCALAACSSAGPSASSDQAPGSVTVAAAAASQPTSVQKAMAATATAVNSFADFNFANGTSLPDEAVLSIEPAVVAPGAGVAYVPISLDRPTPNTVIARYRTIDGSGTDNAAIAGYQYQATSGTVIFRPGDPLMQTVAVPILSMAQGQQFSLKLTEQPWGAAQGTAIATVTADANQMATPESTAGFRAPRTFQPSGTLQWEMSRETMWWDDQGHDGAWSTKLPNGRSQPGNDETGMYLDGWVYRDFGIEAPLRYTDEGLVMHTQVLKQPMVWDGVAYNYGAIVLSGQNTRPVQIGYGQYEFTAKMPNRRGSWPAFWLISTSGWPPEIDIFEGFGFKSYWDFDRNISSTIHGGVPNSGYRTFQRGVTIQSEQTYGLSGFSEGFHSFAVDIQPDYITWFVDGMETYQSVNPFRGYRWYPIMDVAVKTTGPYDDGSGDMIVKSVRVFSN